MVDSGSKCPVCGTDNTKERHVSGTADADLYSCRRCGEFMLAFDSTELPLMLADGDGIEKRAILSHWIRMEHEARQKDLLDTRGPRSRTPLTGELVHNIIRNPRPSLPEQADRFVLWIGDNIKVGGKYIPVDMTAIQAIVGSASYDEFMLVLRHLADDGLVKDKEMGEEDTVHTNVTLSWTGWARYRELKRAASDSRKAFMAMQYGDHQLDEIVEKVFRLAVKETGFDLFKLTERPKAGLIDDRLRVEIRTSRFLIADLTHENRGAYWEAGYAEGLGKPVIYTCEKKKFKKRKTHFDTNHHLTVLWDSEHPEDAGKELKTTIQAELPGDAKPTEA